ncbi:MAG: hypothetical protein GY822_03320 [Deltaproteobacteria bacterium]|nr:hypothetical protein [Deltaproteobacteria bacterium]
MQDFRILKSVLFMVLLGALAACTDNSGGASPAGDDVSFSSAGLDDLFSCFAGEQEAALLDDENAVDDWLSNCEADDSVNVKEAILTEVEGLDDGERLVAVRMIFGGCVQQWHFMGIRQEADVLHAWVLREDTSYGIANAACTDDLGMSERYFIVSDGDVATATSADLVVGVFNPNLPGAPALPGS